MARGCYDVRREGATAGLLREPEALDQETLRQPQRPVVELPSTLRGRAVLLGRPAPSRLPTLGSGSTQAARYWTKASLACPPPYRVSSSWNAREVSGIA